MMKSPILKTTAGIFLVSITTSIFAAVTQSLTLPLTFEYEDNPQLSTSDNKISENRVTLVPNYSITASKGANQFAAGVSVRILRSSEPSISQDRDDPTVNLSWTHDYETGQFSVKALLSDQSSRVSEFIDSGLVSGDNTRKTRSLSINWLNNLSRRTSLTVGGSSTNVTFDGLTTSGLVDYRNDTVRTKLTYTLTDKVETFVQLSFSQYKPDDLIETVTETKSINMGLAWNINETLNLTGSVGSSETISKSEVLSTLSKTNSWQGMLDLQYATLRTNSNLVLTRSQSPASTGSLNEANQVVVSWNYKLSEKDGLGFDYNWRQNFSQTKVVTKRFSTKYIRQISLLWDFRLSLEHKIRDDKLEKAKSSSVMAGIIYKFSGF